jgi:glycosyltransferase involved in cell wall biosynthesis
MEMCAVRVLAPSKISVVANGIDFTLLSEQRQSECLREILKIPADAPVIGTVGRLAPVKRQDILLRVFRRVRERIPGCHLLVVGDGPARQELEFLAQCLGIADAVRFVGYQEHVRQFLDEMDVFVLTSESEGMPLAILEAAATNTPVVAPRVGGVVEIIRDGKTGLLCDFADQAAYVQAIETFLHNLPYAQQVARNARRIAYSEHSIQRVAHDYNVKYLRLVQSGHPRLSE